MSPGSHKSSLPFSLAVLTSKLQPWQGRVVMLVLAGLVTLLLPALLPNAFHTLEEQAGNLGWKLSPVTQTEARFNIIAIDDVR